MTGANDAPLLMLDRVGEGRVALLASDHAWLWDRGYEGGGPQLEMLRRLAHWMMGEPDLEEEALVASSRRVDPDGYTPHPGRRRSLTSRSPIQTEPKALSTLTEGAPGAVQRDDRRGRTGALPPDATGTLETVIALGPAAPREFEETIASADRLLPLTDPLSGAAMRLEDGMPDIRRVAEGRNASGRGWIGRDHAGGLSHHRRHDHAAGLRLVVPADRGGADAGGMVEGRAKLNRRCRLCVVGDGRRMKRCRRDFRQLP
jgi:hypothetical protein